MTRKQFAQLTPVLKAQLLHALFPREIPGYLNHLQGCAMRIIGEQELHYRAWSGPIAAFFLWVYVTRTVYENVTKHEQQMKRNRRAFARLLFKMKARFSRNMRSCITYRIQPVLTGVSDTPPHFFLAN